MKKYNDKRIEIYVNSLIPLGEGNDYGVANFPEKDKMPLNAVKKIKKIIDNYLNLSDVGTLYLATYSTDVISFIHDYGKLKKYKVQIFYKDKKIGINGVLKKFNSVFRYIDKVCHKEDKIMNTTYKINNDTTLVVPIFSSSKFEYIVNNSSNGFINLHIDYTDILYNKNELFIDLCNTIEDKRSIKQLRDTHKTSIQSLIFRFKDDKHIKEIEFIKPNWDISKDSNGQPCVKLTWKKYITETYTKR